MRASRATLSCGKRACVCANRARRFASESARVCFEDEWQPMRSRHCANERCARAKSNPSFAEFREVTIDSRGLGTDLGDTLIDIIKNKPSFLRVLLIARVMYIDGCIRK